jgi:mono/diheme cytochrome c family protein
VRHAKVFTTTAPGLCLALPVLVLLAACAVPAGDAANSGARVYQRSCAGCHGATGLGDGPRAAGLGVPVPDLTGIALRRGGAFPADELYRIIDGQADLRAHGPRHMPVWGYEFYGEDMGDEAAHREATRKVERLLDYLRSIQRQ